MHKKISVLSDRSWQHIIYGYVHKPPIIYVVSKVSEYFVPLIWCSKRLLMCGDHRESYIICLCCCLSILI